MPSASPVARISLKKILVPEDFSDASKACFPFALALAKVYESTVELVHVMPAIPQSYLVFDPVPPEFDYDRQKVMAKLREAQEQMESHRVPVHLLVDRGELEYVIPRLISEENIDLIVLGTHGRHGLSKVVLGSQAEKIYRSATCPVLTVGPKAYSAGPWKIRRILCSVDLGEDPEPTLRYALSLAEDHDAELLLLHSVPLTPWQRRPAVEKRSYKNLRNLIPADAGDWCTPEFMVRWEHPGEAIVCTAEDRQMDLVIMGVRRARAASFSSHLPWPVASEVVGRAPCPVLTVQV